jgi:hypothetical protein
MLAEVRLLDGRVGEALDLADAAHARLARAFPPGGFRVGQAEALLGACRAANGGGAAAAELARTGLAGIVAELGETSPVTARARRFVERATAAAGSRQSR